MPASKTTKKTRSHSAKPKASKPRAATRTAGLGEKATRYGLPTAAVLGAGAVTAGGYMMREQLGELMHGAIEGLTSSLGHLDFTKVLALAGMERKRSFLSASMPVGGFALGLLSGAVLAVWLAPRFRKGDGARPGIVMPAPTDAKSNHVGLDSGIGSPARVVT